MDFAVTVNGKTQWVLTVEGERLLMCLDGEKLKWVEMKDCKFHGVASPEQARPVVVLQPQKQGLSTPKLVRGNHG